MTENSDDRLIVPASTIIILFLTLLVVIPVATLRMSRSLASPIAEVITLVEGGGHFRGRWKIDELEYLVGQEHDEAGSIDTVAVSVRKTGQTEPLTSSTRERNGVIETVLFLDPDGDRYSAVIIAIRSVDSSGSLQVLMYNFSQAGDPTSGQWSDLSEIPEHLSVGYIGHDTIERQSEMLVRTFPIYQQKDGSSEPIGQTRSLIWDFHNGRWRPDPRAQR
ncbi:MAG: hypothetical protein VYD70_02605 [Planctomycetota bacterium]|nr:hypothetical protein [Planctomycetota bacterium]